MADDRYLEEYQSTLGTPTQRSAEMAGQWQAQTGQQCSSQQSSEDHNQYMTRVNAYHNEKNGNP